MNIDALNSTASAIAEGINSDTRLNALVDPVMETMIKGVGSITDNIETMGEFLYLHYSTNLSEVCIQLHTLSFNLKQNTRSY